MNRLKLAMIIIVSGFAYTGYEFNIFYSTEVEQMQRELSGYENQIKGKQSQLRRLRQFAQSIEVIKQELRELNLQLRTALDRLPPKFNLASLLRALTAIAKNSGVILVNFRPAAAESRVQGSFISSKAISFEVRGAYTQCLVYFDQITRLKRIINIDSIGISAGATRRRNRSTANVNEIRASTKIVTYRFSK